jgi:DNA-binding NtrC family response regulator
LNGNVRELRNLVQRAFILANHEITPDCVAGESLTSDASSDSVLEVRVGSSIAEAGERLILATLKQCGGNKVKAAEMLGISLKTLYNRLNVYAASHPAND